MACDFRSAQCRCVSFLMFFCCCMRLLRAITRSVFQPSVHAPCSSGTDKTVKIFDVLNFDMINFLKLDYAAQCCCWVWSAAAVICCKRDVSCAGASCRRQSNYSGRQVSCQRNARAHFIPSDFPPLLFLFIFTATRPAVPYTSTTEGATPRIPRLFFGRAIPIPSPSLQ